jgi:uncharacterized protein YcfL
MKRLSLGAAAVVAALAAAGCSSSTEPFTPGADPVSQTNYPRVTTTGDLARWLLVDKPVITNEGVMKVTTPVRLNSSTGQWSKVQYRYIFLDKNGVPLRAQPDWQQVTLEPRQAVFMSGNAMDDNAADWRLEIRPNR